MGIRAAHTEEGTEQCIIIAIGGNEVQEPHEKMWMEWERNERAHVAKREAKMGKKCIMRTVNHHCNRDE